MSSDKAEQEQRATSSPALQRFSVSYMGGTSSEKRS